MERKKGYEEESIGRTRKEKQKETKMCKNRKNLF